MLRQDRIVPLGLPHGPFDPAVQPDSVLEQYGLPTPNAMPTNPKAAAFRREFLQPRRDGPPLRFAPALASPEFAADATVITRTAPTGQPAQKSVNWSGAYQSPRDGHRFVSVMAEWKVPSVSVPPGRAEPEFHSSTWIGLDGQKLYLDSSLPQIGTKQRCGPGLAGQPEYYAWFQWWARGQDTEEEPLELPVAPGDRISAILTVADAYSVICNLKNITQDVILEAFKAWAPSPCRISGATAEWIMERPSPPVSDGWEAYPLPVYTPFAFTSCIAETRPVGSTALHDRDLEGARLIRMYEIIANPPGTRTVSTARRVLLPEQKLELSHVAS
ncbi:MAG TPA: G1 family glutamic endopeptidase [Bosea sp. (in: a-proteobacteria)]|uniref:G1 family glutamic endopeptidase n=1 Tax=Bosea sp. (in: a-proteobacteria) TaxID=1871050 RepID=UPI002E0E5379|nr:G1 family glutamic endopeptidase [Bosea sp. (in: a-proteobacteria)]